MLYPDVCETVCARFCQIRSNKIGLLIPSNIMDVAVPHVHYVFWFQGLRNQYTEKCHLNKPKPLWI